MLYWINVAKVSTFLICFVLDIRKKDFNLSGFLGRWQDRRTPSFLTPQLQLDNLQSSVNNPENNPKTGRTNVITQGRKGTALNKVGRMMTSGNKTDCGCPQWGESWWHREMWKTDIHTREPTNREYESPQYFTLKTQQAESHEFKAMGTQSLEF